MEVAAVGIHQRDRTLVEREDDPPPVGRPVRQGGDAIDMGDLAQLLPVRSDREDLRPVISASAWNAIRPFRPGRWRLRRAQGRVSRGSSGPRSPGSSLAAISIHRYSSQRLPCVYSGVVLIARTLRRASVAGNSAHTRPARGPIRAAPSRAGEVTRALRLGSSVSVRRAGRPGRPGHGGGCPGPRQDRAFRRCCGCAPRRSCR